VSCNIETDKTGMLSPPNVWLQQSEFVSSRQSGHIPAAVHIGFECCCNGQTVSNRSLDTYVGLNVATRFCDVYPDKCWFAVLRRFWLQCSRSLKGLVHTLRFSLGREVALIAGQSSGTQESIGVFTRPGRLTGRKFTARLPGSAGSIHCHIRSPAGG